MEFKRLVRKVAKLETQIEETSKEVLEDGYFENVYGTFDNSVLASQVLKIYERLLEIVPGDLSVKHAYAGVLVRFKDFDVARLIYEEIKDEVNYAWPALAALEIEAGNLSRAKELIDEYNLRLDRQGMSFMRTDLEGVRFKKA